MRVIPSRAARTAVRSLLVPAATIGLFAVASPQAAAHTGLEGSDPANGAVVGTLPRSVTLTFSDPMTRKYAQLAVTGPGGAALGDGAPTVSGRTVTLRLKDVGPAAGAYTVGYRVVSADGHPVTGTSAFTVRPAATSAAATPSAPSPSATAPAPAGGASSTPSPRSSLSRTAVASGERAETSLKAIGIGFGIGLPVMIAAMVVTVRRRGRSADDAGQ
ncbi:copper resistance CopC family protein [Streptomyces sp. NPDC002057]|uniref:copper resistance CopC family protein n=1 Tax=Streptomyces sp. NPDC002057 TaxID=3154664 RepID=UPI0033231127